MYRMYTGSSLYLLFQKGPIPFSVGRVELEQCESVLKDMGRADLHVHQGYTPLFCSSWLYSFLDGTP